MMSRILLSKPSIICSAPSDDLLNIFQNGEIFLSKDNSYLQREILVGKCKHLSPLPKDIEFSMQTRTNSILYNAILKLEPLILRLRDMLKGEDIGVSIGTTTTGIGENYLAVHDKINNTKLNLEYINERSELCSPAEFLKRYYNLSSLAFSTSTACTSGGKAIIQAARMLKAGLCKAVICGGVDSLNHLSIAGFASLDILSSSYAKPFASDRDGINIGEGACVFTLIREDLLLEYPMLEEDFKLVLLDYASNNDAFHITKPSPNINQQLDLLKRFNNMDYINLHGTGTLANDEMEARLISSLFKEIPCSSIKPFIGHTLGAAGAIELGVCANMILSSIECGYAYLPPHIYEYDTTLPAITIARRGEKMKINSALSISFAFGGDNSAILLGSK